MKEETIAFSTLPISNQVGFSDRISFLYLEYSKIVQTESGLVAYSTNNEETLKQFIQIPVAALCLLSLGPGTSISQAALISCARSGCVVQFSGGGGFPSHSSIVSLSSSSKWAIAQAKIVSDNTLAKKVAKEFYGKQFSNIGFDGSITQMRGLEGSLIKAQYRELSKKYGVKNWKRNPMANDNVNASLNIGNNLLYGLASSLTGALSLNNALGVIHRGHFRSFLFDIADLYKTSLTIPIAFSLHDVDSKNIPKLTRKALRKKIHDHRIQKDMFKFVTSVLSPYLPESEEHRLIGTTNEVIGHKNYSDNRTDKIAAEKEL